MVYTIPSLDNTPLEEDEVVEFVDHALDEIFDPEEDESRTKWREHLLVPCEEAWLGLLLVRLTRLERITFGQEDSQLMSDIFRKAARHQRPFHQTLPFPHLREVLVDVQWSKAWVGSDFLTPFFYLPAVRRISGGPIGESDPEDLDKMSFGTSNSACPVREFTITEAWWCRGMFDWLAACTELEHITIVLSHHRDDLELPDSDMFKAPDFRNALLPFTGTLKTLQIEAHPRQTFHGDWWSNIADHTGPFGSFKEFAVLESLRIRHAHLGLQSTSGSICVTGGPLIDILPSSLRSLEILEIDEDEYLNLVEEFSHLIQCRASFPRLAQIILYVEEAAEDVFEPLKHEYGIAGINFQIDTKLPDW
ncbi:hypothetical protein N7452_006609 [Penicillium brevicompactum]|uniref:Leucine-rich repeat domain-containing protein n=1 Tax=Penicillium brevicompactum TaxID=5074 RepID=A0A9W9QL02_PENBR|nr:hypothetical protein N7452_006609 [Penicillium brevicompactum]